MTTETKALTVRDVAGLAAEVAMLSEPERVQLVSAFVQGLSPELVPVAALRAQALAALVRDIAKELDLRMTLDGVQEWTDPETERRYAFTANAYRVCVDPRGLFDEFVRRGVSVGDLAQAIAARGLRISDLRRLVGKDKERAAILAEYFTWRDGPKHLRALDDEGEPDGD